jgi:hypothetical protein
MNIFFPRNVNILTMQCSKARHTFCMCLPRVRSIVVGFHFTAWEHAETKSVSKVKDR